ncbi:dihydropyrimidinase [Salidesulfovibrio onnuriiensis]|uniref:dihydropyrimidinase n=1 Tax=Salidesulfovibrio onnuriiensis TaxID=2583823 RepID=UPI0011C7FC53|nr:dihydropyrimidinase [Salidesulfovibrio onnuriiensis]
MTAVLVKGGTVVTSTETLKADVRVENGRIAGVGADLSSHEAHIIDATGKLVLPGGVDVHTHFNLEVGGLKVADGFHEGTRSAACGGTTTIVEHPGFTEDGSITAPIANYRKQAQNNCVTDYALHGVVAKVGENTKDDLAALVREGIPSVKVYMTYAGRLNDEEMIRVLEIMKAEHGLVTVHAENHEVIAELTRRLKDEGRLAPTSHPLSRPGYCEAEAVERMIALSRAAGNAPLYIVHLSTGAGLEAIRRAKAEGLPVYAETCPQYLLLTDDEYAREGDDALKYVLSPPLRKREDCEALWQGLADGSIDTVATDHCSFNLSQKTARGRDNIFACPGGIPGAETRLPLLYSEGVAKGRITLNRFVELVSTAPARIMGLAPAKGDIAPGADADIVILDPERKVTISPETLCHNADYNPYEGFVATGWPETVLLRGEAIIENNEFREREALGRFIERSRFTE